jgi:hypothetical protein
LSSSFVVSVFFGTDALGGLGRKPAKKSQNPQP